jgi:membrane-associated phospholipid phosphatase
MALRTAPGSGPGLRARRRLSTRLAVALLVALPAALAVALVLVAIEGSWAPLHRLDASAAQRLHIQAVGHPLWVRTLILISDVGSPTVVRIVVGLLAIVLWVRGARRLALWAAATMIGGAVIDVVLKTVVARARPHFPNPVASAPGASFPSGHAFTATLGAGVLVLWLLPLVPALWRIAVWAVGAFVPLAVGFSRIALGVHWISDVVGGWLLGIGLLAATTAAFEAWRRDQGRAPVQPTVEGVAPEESASAAHPADHSPGEG